jgi:hypothetical protein
MPKFKIELARLVRQVAVVEVERDEEPEDYELSEVFEEYEGDAEWTDDFEWGSDEGTHRIIEE